MIPSSLIQSLASAANNAINQNLLNGAPGQSKPTGEVGFVAAVVLGAVTDIAVAWNPILNPHGYSVKLTGVFCHQTPRASFTDSSGISRTCELADLLVVADDLTRGAPSKRWAALIQAKMAKAGRGKTLSGKGDLVQLDLMTNWPHFKLPNPFQAHSRDFSNCAHPGSSFHCGRYGLIEPQPNPKWTQHAPAKTMPPTGDQLGSFLANMIESGQSGYGREATGTGDDWSQTVDELLRITGGLAFTYIAGFKGSRPRKNEQIAFILPNSWFTNSLGVWIGAPPPSGGKPELPEDGPGSEGISFLHIGVSRWER